MTVEQLVRKCSIKLEGDNTLRVPQQYTTPEEMEEIKAKKEEIKEYLREEKAREEATIKVKITGWETKEIFIDTRKNLEEQLEAQEVTMEEYERAMGIEAAEENTEEATTENETITEEEYKIWKETYNNVYNEGGEGYTPPKEKVTRKDIEWANKISKK